MGKFTSSKKTYRKDPMGLGNVNEEQPFQPTDLNDGNTLMNEDLSQAISNPGRLLELISSPESIERDFAFKTISEFVLDNPAFLETFIKPDTLRKAITYTCDPDIQVRVAAIGAFRNLTVAKEDICDTLISLDILTPILSNFIQGINYITSLSENEIKQQKSVESQHVLIQIIALINNLCESSEKGFLLVSKECQAILSTLFQILIKNSIFIQELILTISEFLTVITDDNKQLNLTINNDLVLQLFNVVKESTNMNTKLKVLISITLLNIGSLYNKELVIQSITPILLSALQFQPIQTLTQHIKPILDQSKSAKDNFDTIAKQNEDELEMEEEFVDDTMGDEAEETTNENIENNNNVVKPSNKEKRKEKREKNKAKKTAFDSLLDKEKVFKDQNDLWKDSLSAQQSSIELFVNMLSEAQQDESNQQDNVYDDDDKFLDIEDGNTTSSQQILSTISKFLISTSLYQNLVELINNIISFDLTTFAKSNVELLSNVVSLKVVQKRALTCLSNLLIIYIPKEETTQKSLWELLTKIFQQSFTTNDAESIEMITNSIWSILRTNSNIGFTSENEIKNLVNLASGATNSIKTNLIGIIGIVGQKPYSQSILKEIGTFLLQCLSKDSPADIISESLNSIFDIFAEPPVNQIAKEIQMIQQLEAFVPIIRNKIKLDKKKLDRALLDRLDESRINLSRFIAYKKSQK
ncbi:hypothetical protein DICPUDRAFT_77593 [Dictyostelium purpureum]|uniref:SYO1-like TPR repeats domain-containing protein n=1 Tax=Dictyostelium purpureum TaxID=5786 RepID=F0ZH32_DICPU|nr:uncharacterized protein DICPUDRAFT_77593 [Dictyostelium purpureum]EGC36763.1 hypothetical protein DICPUDRAFT_77593 [Dictyostelium purpureum]|eukprot:XP_003286709.1 hypothetical protein DICPUDRAFT_77593 [Dictyostelium purpureum]